MLTNDIIRRALIQYLNADPHLVFINVVANGKNFAVFPDDVLQAFDNLVKAQS